ncbi:MAG: EAL domain-containing protein [Faecalibacterium sp.]
MKKQVLIVEDNDLNRAMLSEILSEEYQVLEAEDGEAALAILRHHSDSIALILLDIIMPVMDGYTFLEKIKNSPALSFIPVIVLTQSDSEVDEISALSHGATDFVPKPYSAQVILHRVASIIKLRETAAMINQLQYDRLTGLYSKEFFYKKVREILDSDPDNLYTIISTNIENFKLYNDIFTPEAGDQLLQKFAEKMQHLVGENGLCCRYGADHFLGLKKRKTDQKERQNFFNDALAEFLKGTEHIVCKWGVYEITDRSIPVEKMCDRALLAVNSIKGQYNRTFAVYDDSLRSKLLQEKMITDAMKSALDQKQFVVYYQPKFDLKKNCIAGAEAVVRWNHPEWGLVFPGEFIPLFEKNGFITQLDQYVWEQVCIQLHSWKEMGYPLLPVSVNISRADIYKGSLIETLLSLINKYQLDPTYLHLEITESAYVETLGPVVSTVKELRELGFIAEMDDFGSGYSSLNMLSQMKIDILKLDRAFIQSETSKPVEQSILMDVITMAHRMRLTVVAEGVETRDQLDLLRSVGCDYVQGYYFAKPLPVREYEEFLKDYPPQTQASTAETPKYKAESYSLLVVDENAAYRQKVRETFEPQYHILEAADANSALGCVKSCDSILAVVLSMTLPENGAAVLMNALRRDPLFWKIPVLACLPSGDCAAKYPLALEADDFLCKCHPLCDMTRRVRRLVEKVSATERETALLDAANRDYMTNLLNRRGLQVAISTLRREDWPLAVYMFDMDDLKLVNDTGSHKDGDRMIQVFAEVLRRMTRNGDILCRYGGDEFLAILKRIPNEEVALRKARDIRTMFRSRFQDADLAASCSAGVVLCQSDECLLSGLIEQADQALYCAKREEKGGCILWTTQNPSVGIGCAPDSL